MVKQLLIFLLITFYLFLIPCSARAEESLYFIHQDHLGSTSMVTDEQGNVVSKQNYYPYGTTRSQSLSTNYQSPITNHQYTSQISDQEQTGLYYYNARYYNPQIAKFISADKLEGPNRYVYVTGNPINLIDPTGNAETPDDPGGGGGGGNSAVGLYLPTILKTEDGNNSQKGPFTMLNNAMQYNANWNVSEVGRRVNFYSFAVPTAIYGVGLFPFIGTWAATSPIATKILLGWGILDAIGDAATYLDCMLSQDANICSQAGLAAMNPVSGLGRLSSDIGLTRNTDPYASLRSFPENKVVRAMLDLLPSKGAFNLGLKNRIAWLSGIITDEGIYTANTGHFQLIKEVLGDPNYSLQGKKVRDFVEFTLDLRNMFGETTSWLYVRYPGSDDDGGVPLRIPTPVEIRRLLFFLNPDFVKLGGSHEFMVNPFKSILD